MKKKWIINNQELVQSNATTQEQLHPIVQVILQARGFVTPEQQEKFLNPNYDQHLHDPFLFQDMQKAVERIFQAIENKEKIIVHGDYDADGVCSSAIIITILRDLGADVDVYIPHREKEGYGVAMATVQHLIHNHGVQLIITVDCGTANIEPIEYAQDQGVDVIITDHHHVPELVPSAYALINPQNSNDTYPFGYLCGAGVAFKVAQALYLTDQQRSTPRLQQGYDKWLLDLVAVATIADMMPLHDENRVLVHFGLTKVLPKTKNKGLLALMKRSGVWSLETKEIQPFDVGFVIGPRLNAAGRMDHANTAYGLLMELEDQRIEELVEEIEQTNTKRKTETEAMVQEAYEQIDTTSDEYLIFAYKEGWPLGLVGLVAGKILAETGKPAIVATRLPDRIAGSGRSVPQFNMALQLEELRDHFTTAGGHAVACGFSLEPDEKKLEYIKEEFQRRAKEALEGVDLLPELKIDTEITFQDLTWKLYDDLVKMRPFGKDHEEPVFVLRQAQIEHMQALGVEKQHLKIKVRDAKTLKSINAIGFNLGEYFEQIKEGGYIDIACTVDKNEWNGNKELQLKMLDIHIHD